MKEITITLTPMRDCPTLLAAVRAGTKLRVKANVYGMWAAHPAINRDGWDVTLVPAGISVTARCHLTKYEAMAAARRLGVSLSYRGPLGLLISAVTADRWLIESLVAEAIADAIPVGA